MSPQLFGQRIQILKEGLDFSTAKNRSISSNIANVETPGYKAFRVVMREKLGEKSVGKGELTTTHQKHISSSRSSGTGNFNVVRDDSTTMRVDGNNVDLERELAEMSANSIYFTALSRFISKNFAGIRSIITEGKR